MPYTLMVQFCGSFLAIVFTGYSIWIFITNKEMAIKTVLLLEMFACLI
jgi:hypothetical protein